MLTDELERVVTRRSVVSTGAKLAYAAPLVAVSFKLSTRGAAALSPTEIGNCFHSNDANPAESCMDVCTGKSSALGCPHPGDFCDGFGGPGPHGPCVQCNISPGNKCPSTDYCDADCFTCDTTTGVVTFTC